MFTNHNAAVVIEFYPFYNISNSTNWRITGLLGWIAILLDSRSYDALTSASASEGMRTEGLVVENEGDLTADNSKYLTAEIFLRLVIERHPTKNLLAFFGNNIPVLPSYYDKGNRQNGVEPVYLQVAVPKKGFLPVIQSSASPVARPSEPPVVRPSEPPVARPSAPPVAHPSAIVRKNFFLEPDFTLLNIRNPLQEIEFIIFFFW
jgi:hypothetical protein